MNASHDKYRVYLESLSPDSLSDLTSYVADDIHFKDPFNDVRGLDAMASVFQHMFENVQNIRFNVQDMLAKEQVCFMAWRFEGEINGKLWAFNGTSVIRFADDGRVEEHIDHWDAGRDFYERLPFIGWLIAFLRRRLSSH
jgi:steroid delta-isomerase